FNVYRDMMHVGTVPYMGEGLEDTIGFVDNPVDPGCYDYTVTAVYDLTEYGFPGQTAESMHEGPDTVCVVWGYDLPFAEMWDSGDFGFNGWRLGAGENNWVVSNQNGNPEPSAQFNWDPDPEGEYAIALESAPLKADLYTEGKIWLDFHYALDNRVATGEEHLVAEVYNGMEWYQVFQVANTGDMDYTPAHVDISAFAMGRVFMVRFVAMGMNSFDIINWNVDNIHVYRQCDAPSDLDGEYYWDDVEVYGAAINWMAPEIPLPPEGWIRWDDGTPAAPVGLAEGGDWSAAIRWDAGQLAEYEGTLLTEIQFYMADDSFDHVKVKVWQGMNGSMLVHESDTLYPDSAMWTTYTVDPPIAIDALDELWVGYTIVGQVPGTFPASMDAGPAETGYGDKITTDGVTWDNASDFGLDGNWNIAAYLAQPDNAPTAVVPLIDTHIYNNNGNVTLVAGAPNQGAASPALESSRAFTGFNIYRMGPDEMDYTLIDFVRWEEGVNDYSYMDENPYPEAGLPYDVCYKVTAVWESDTDYCESDAAMALVDDYICITVTSIDNPLEDGMTALYPNPASDRVNVASSSDITRITIVNYVGQIVYDAEITAERSLTINTASYEAGVYIVKIETENGMVTKRLAITK
ncbi:MAG: T9SS type A sorting domain-containing protein, partial [bacterium]